MSGLLRKRFTTLLIMCCLFVTLGSAQSDAIILGKVESPLSRVVRFEYKRNHYSLEEGSFEATLDTNNVFAIRIKLVESRAISCTYRESAVKLFVAPGDTLKMNFTGDKMLETISFDGTAAPHNEYLVKTQRAFPDWLNENTLVKARLSKGSREYLGYVDSLFSEKRSFFDRYPADAKANFTNDFLEFATNDINYWRAYELMLYVKTYGLNNSAPEKMIDDSYFNFTLETDNIYYKALNNEYYLQYLELYLSYLAEKSGLGHKEPMEVVEEKSHSVKTVKPKGRNLRVIEEPYLPKDVVSWLSPSEEAVYQNLLTGEKFKYVGEDSTYEDIFLKIKTSEGKSGWVPQSAISIYEKTVIERTVRNRFCFQPEEPLCGFDKHLSGKVLYFTAAKDLMYSFVYEKMDVIDLRVKKFIEKNQDHREFNDIIKASYDLTIKDRLKGVNRLSILASCEVEDYGVVRDRVMYAKSLKNLRPTNNEVVVDYTGSAPKPKKQEPKSESLIKTPAPVAEVKKPETKVETPPAPVAEVKKPETKVETPPATVAEVKKPETKVETPPATVAEVKKPETTTPPVKPLVESPAITNFTGEGQNKGLQFNLPSGGLLSLGEYDPSGKPLIFKGMTINESITPFEFTDITNNAIRQQELLGKIVVLNFWATWCSPCKPTLEYTQRLASKYSDKDVVFIYISIDSDDETWKEYLKEHTLKGIQGRDRDKLVRINLGVQGIPNYFIVNKNGRIAYNSILQSKLSAEEMIDMLLKSP